MGPEARYRQSGLYWGLLVQLAESCVATRVLAVYLKRG